MPVYVEAPLCALFVLGPREVQKQNEHLETFIAHRYCRDMEAEDQFSSNSFDCILQQYQSVTVRECF